jgi:protein involved in temperature-dependent protein secretion
MKAIITKWIPATDTKPTRISASDGDGNKIVIPCTYGDTDPSDEAVKALCAKMEWHGKLAKGWTPLGNVYVFINEHDAFEV